MNIRELRHTLWGYHAKSVDSYIAALRARVADRQHQRAVFLTELKGQLQEAQNEVDAAQSELQSLQSDYFRLSGEINALNAHADQMLQDSHNDWLAVEQEAQKAVAERREYAESLAHAIHQVPQDIRGIIENIARVIADTPVRSRNSEPLPTGESNPLGTSHG